MTSTVTRSRSARIVVAHDDRQKAVMAVTGLIMLLFLIFHMLG